MESHKCARSEAAVHEDVLGTFRAMAMVVREQAITTTFMAQQMTNGNSNRNGYGHGDEYMRFTEFRKVNPPSFKGTYDPDVVDEWIKEMEKIFSIVTCNKEQKVSFAASMLKANAEF